MGSTPIRAIVFINHFGGLLIVTRKILDLVEDIEGDQQKADLAARILNRIDPNGRNLLTFFDALDDDIHAELISRAIEQEDRD